MVCCSVQLDCGPVTEGKVVLLSHRRLETMRHKFMAMALERSWPRVKSYSDESEF